MTQESGSYKSAGGDEIKFWKVRGNGGMLLNTRTNEITMYTESGEPFGTISIEAGLRLLGWAA